MSRIPTLIIGTRRDWRDPIGWLLRILVAVLFVLFSLGKFSSDPHGEWFRIFARIGFGQWFRIATGVIELVGGLLFLLPGTARFAALPLAATMLGAALAQLTVLGHPVWAIIPIALLVLVVIVGFRDPSLDDTIATLQQRRANRTSVTATKPRA